MLPPALFPAGRKGERLGGTRRIIGRRRKTFLVSLDCAEAGGQGYTLQVAQDRTVDEQFEKEFGLLVVAVLVVRMFSLPPCSP